MSKGGSFYSHWKIIRPACSLAVQQRAVWVSSPRNLLKSCWDGDVMYKRKRFLCRNERWVRKFERLRVASGCVERVRVKSLREVNGPERECEPGNKPPHSALDSRLISAPFSPSGDRVALSLSLSPPRTHFPCYRNRPRRPLVNFPSEPVCMKMSATVMRLPRRLYNALNDSLSYFLSGSGLSRSFIVSASKSTQIWNNWIFFFK